MPAEPVDSSRAPTDGSAKRRKKKKRPGRARLLAAFEQRARDPAGFRRALPKLRHLFERAGLSSLLLELMLADGSIGLSRIDFLVEAYLLAADLGRQAEVTERIRGLRDDGTLVAMPWSFDFKLGRLVGLGRAVSGLIIDLKYEGIVPDPDDPLAAARQVGDRILFPEGLLDRLFEVSRFRSLGRPAWEAGMRTACALDHLTSDLQNRPCSFFDAERLLDRAALERAIAPLTGQALLCLTFHGGYLSVSKQLFAESFADGARLQLAATRNTNEISVRGDTRAALFKALAVLRQARALLVAPDAGIGALKGTLPVLGHDVPAAEGTAFLAYETACRCSWFAFAFRDGRFVPEFVEGPRAEPAEDFRSFQRRLFAFVGTRIEEVLTGDPLNLAFRSPWANIVLGRDERPPD